MEYNNRNINLLSEQLDMNNSLINKIAGLEAKSHSDRSEVMSLNKIIGEQHGAIKKLSQELAATARQLSDAIYERDEVCNQLERDRSDNQLMGTDRDRSITENIALREQLISRTEELTSVQEELDDLYRAMRQQKMESEEAVNVLEPELEVLKNLNQGLHGQISRLGRDIEGSQSEKHALREHIKDLTSALDGFTAKYNAEADQRQRASNQLHDKTVLLVSLQSEHDRSQLKIEELQGEIEQMLLLDRAGDREEMRSEIERLSDEVDRLHFEGDYLREESRGLQCEVAEQLLLRGQDRDSFKSLLIASGENTQLAVASSKRQLETISDNLVSEAQRIASDANQARKVTGERCHEAECRVQVLTGELESLRGEFDKMCASSGATEKSMREELSCCARQLETVEKNREEEISALTAAAEDALTISRIRLSEKRDNAEAFISRLSLFQDCLREVREEAWAMKVKVNHLETQLTLVRSHTGKCKRNLLDSLTLLQEDQCTAFQCARRSIGELTAASKGERERAMYLSSEVTNLKLELYESRRKRNIPLITN